MHFPRSSAKAASAATLVIPHTASFLLFLCYCAAVTRRLPGIGLSLQILPGEFILYLFFFFLFLGQFFLALYE